MAYQYVVVRMPAADNPQKAEEAFTERLNAVAAEGWRFVGYNQVTANKWSFVLATFEREVES